MHVLEVRNVNEALPAGLAYLLKEGAVRETRAGPALTASGPVTTHYSLPRERVLFSPVRDHNPFFAVGESVWMLAGREDSGFLDVFVKDFGSRFAESDGTIAGAYGYRWREAFGFDQLKFIIEQLKKDPGTRQAVLQMWDCRDQAWGDGRVGQNELKGVFRDRCCNTHVYFRMRRGELDMTVCNRSNDAIFGAYGANAVHFSFLQEYIAGMVGIPVGQYWQMSNDLHAYTTDIDKLCKKVGYNPPKYNTPDQSAHAIAFPSELSNDRYSRSTIKPGMPLVTDPYTFEYELLQLNHYLDWLNLDGTLKVKKLPVMKNVFLSKVIWPMACAHRAHKQKEHEEADISLECIQAEDWRIAATEWVQRRRK